MHDMHNMNNMQNIQHFHVEDAIDLHAGTPYEISPDHLAT
jgi:hypothetical protein